MVASCFCRDCNILQRELAHFVKRSLMILDIGHLFRTITGQLGMARASSGWDIRIRRRYDYTRLGLAPRSCAPVFALRFGVQVLRPGFGLRFGARVLGSGFGLGFWARVMRSCFAFRFHFHVSPLGSTPRPTLRLDGRTQQRGLEASLDAEVRKPRRWGWRDRVY